MFFRNLFSCRYQECLAIFGMAVIGTERYFRSQEVEFCANNLDLLRLSTIVGPENVHWEKGVLNSQNSPYRNSQKGSGDYDFFVQAKTHEQIAELVEEANKHDWVLIPKAGGTSLIGAATPGYTRNLAEGRTIILVDLKGLKFSYFLKDSKMLLLGAGVDYDEANRFLQPYSRQLPWALGSGFLSPCVLAAFITGACGYDGIYGEALNHLAGWYLVYGNGRIEDTINRDDQNLNYQNLSSEDLVVLNKSFRNPFSCDSESNELNLRIRKRSAYFSEVQGEGFPLSGTHGAGGFLLAGLVKTVARSHFSSAYLIRGELKQLKELRRDLIEKGIPPAMFEVLNSSMVNLLKGEYGKTTYGGVEFLGAKRAVIFNQYLIKFQELLGLKKLPGLAKISAFFFKCLQILPEEKFDLNPEGDSLEDDYTALLIFTDQSFSKNLQYQFQKGSLFQGKELSWRELGEIQAEMLRKIRDSCAGTIGFSLQLTNGKLIPLDVVLEGDNEEIFSVRLIKFIDRLLISKYGRGLQIYIYSHFMFNIYHIDISVPGGIEDNDKLAIEFMLRFAIAQKGGKQFAEHGANRSQIKYFNSFMQEIHKIYEIQKAFDPNTVMNIQEKLPDEKELEEGTAAAINAVNEFTNSNSRESDIITPQGKLNSLEIHGLFSTRGSAYSTPYENVFGTDQF